MIALIILGAIWFLIFVIIALVFTGEAGISSMISSVWFLVASLPGFIMMFSGIVGKVLSNKLKGTENKLKWTEKRLSEMILEESKAEKKEEQPRNDQL
ncbi:hypothetical protein ES703_16321 [subsurface metagenome]|nr:hypothetical protein [bacterium]